MQHVASTAIQRQLIVVYVLLNFGFFSNFEKFPILAIFCSGSILSLGVGVGVGIGVGVGVGVGVGADCSVCFSGGGVPCSKLPVQQ